MMRLHRSIHAFGLAAACTVVSCSDETAPPNRPTPDEAACDAGDQAFVRRALHVLSGRPPWGQAEVNAWEQAIGALRAEGDPDPRRTVGRAMMTDPSFLRRWSDFFMDSLYVPRLSVVRDSRYDLVQAKRCFGASAGLGENVALAEWVRDNSPLVDENRFPAFTMRDLLTSSLLLDDLSPVYRAHLFHMLTFPLPGANVPPLELERARRMDFGVIFEDAYIHRDPSCLKCHNSEFSVTYDDDPALNRAFPLAGRFEEAVFGSSTGSEESIRHRSMLRFSDVVTLDGIAPWGWNGPKCGNFVVPLPLDPLGVDTIFASLRATEDDPARGQKASVWGLENALRRGFDEIAKDGITRNGDQLPDPDEAFAFLVSANIAEKVWTEAVGSPLTVATYFPRSQVQSDTLQQLTDRFIETRFSLRELLLEIVSHEAFNPAMPEEGCGEAPYGLPMIYDAWSRNEPSPELQGNSSADRIQSVPTRPLRLGLHTAMEWAPPPDFPTEAESEEIEFATSIGYFVSSAERGFSGFDFQARLSWEGTYGRCDGPGAPDFISGVVERAVAAGSVVEDAVIALKDRLIGEPFVEESERSSLEGLLGMSLASTDLSRLDEQLRIICGAYTASPQFLLPGMPARDAEAVPVLAPVERAPAASCASVVTAIADTVPDGEQPIPLVCSDEGVVTAIKLIE